MEEFMRGDLSQFVRITGKRLRIDADCGAVRVLHPTSAPRVAQKVVEEYICAERTIIHPTCFSLNNASERRNNLAHVIITGNGVDDYTIVPATFIKIPLFKLADFDGGVH